MLARAGQSVCITITHWDGLVFARSAFRHSAHYRCVMLFGEAQEVPEDEKTASLHTLMERVAPGRDAELRPMTEQELKATALLRVPINRVSAKIKQGPPTADPLDTDWPVWEGILPVAQIFQPAKSTGASSESYETPDNVERLVGTSI